MYYNPVREIADRFNILQSAMAALERIFTLLDEPEGVQDDDDALDLPGQDRGRGRVRARVVRLHARTRGC